VGISTLPKADSLAASLIKLLTARQADYLPSAPTALVQNDNWLKGLVRQADTHGGEETLRLESKARARMRALSGELSKALDEYTEAIAEATQLPPSDPSGDGGWVGAIFGAVGEGAVTAAKATSGVGTTLSEADKSALLAPVHRILNRIHENVVRNGKSVLWGTEEGIANKQDRVEAYARHWVETLDWAIDTSSKGAAYDDAEPLLGDPNQWITATEAKDTYGDKTPLYYLLNWMERAEGKLDQIDSAKARIEERRGSKALTAREKTAGVNTTAQRDAVLEAQLSRLEGLRVAVQGHVDEVRSFLKRSTVVELTDPDAKYLPSKDTDLDQAPYVIQTINSFKQKFGDTLIADWAGTLTTVSASVSEVLGGFEDPPLEGEVEPQLGTLWSTEPDKRPHPDATLLRRRVVDGEFVWEYQRGPDDWVAIEGSGYSLRPPEERTLEQRTLYHTSLTDSDGKPVTRTVATSYITGKDGVMRVHARVPIVKDGVITNEHVWKPLNAESGWTLDEVKPAEGLRYFDSVMVDGPGGTRSLRTLYRDTDGNIVLGELITVQEAIFSPQTVTEELVDAWSKTKLTGGRYETLSVEEAMAQLIAAAGSSDNFASLTVPERRKVLESVWDQTHEIHLTDEAKDAYPDYREMITVRGAGGASSRHHKWYLDLLRTAEESADAYSEFTRIGIRETTAAPPPYTAGADPDAQIMGTTVAPPVATQAVLVGQSIDSENFKEQMRIHAQAAAAAIADKVGDVNDDLTLEEARQNFGYLTTLIRGMSEGDLTEAEKQEVLEIIDGLAGMTTVEAQRAVDRIVTARQASINQANLERGRAYTRERDAEQARVNRIEEQRSEMLGIRAGIASLQQRQKESIAGVHKAIAAAQEAIAAEYLQQAPGFGPMREGAKIGGAPIYEQLAERAGLVSPGYLPYGAPPPEVPQASSIQAFQEALAEARKEVQYGTEEELLAGLPAREPIPAD
jgi:hypothetical protein